MKNILLQEEKPLIEIPSMTDEELVAYLVPAPKESNRILAYATLLSRLESGRLAKDLYINHKCRG